MDQMKKTFADLARGDTEAAQGAVVAIFRRLASRRSKRITLTFDELLAAQAFQLVGETAADGKSLTFTLEKKVAVL